MCGIFGQCCCATPSDRFEALVAGLRALQYRGYDSCGVAWLQPTDGAADNDRCEIGLARAVGTVQALQQVLPATVDVGTPPALVDDSCSSGDDHDDDSGTFDSAWCAIAHTRWATHGVVAERNTHPHRVDRLAIVHNGVVSNLDQLRKHVHGTFASQQSETDTEVLLQAIALEYRALLESCSSARERLLRAVNAALKHVEGAFALALISADLPECVLLARRGSPLAIGFADDLQQPRFWRRDTIGTTLTVAAADTGNRDCCGGCFTFASDLNALQQHAQRALLLADDDIVLIDAVLNRCDVYYAGAHPGAATVPLDCSSGDDGDCKRSSAVSATIASIHSDYDDGLCMYREIFEQPISLQRAMAGRLLQCDDDDDDDDDNDDAAGARRALDVALGGLDDYWHQIRVANRLVMIACGTSYYAALAARPLFEHYCDREVLVERATPLLDRQMPIRRGDACFFLSQSGETADTLAALRHCRKAGALCVGIVNAVASSIARLTDCGLYLKCGPEVGVASTKAYTAQIAVLALIAARLARDGAAKTAVLRALHSVPSAIESTLQIAEPWAKWLAQRWRDEPRCILLGRGSDEATCYEGALKIKELCYVLAEGCHAGELKHGPLALVDETLPIVMFDADTAADDEPTAHLSRKMRVAIQQILARGGSPLIVRPESSGAAWQPNDNVLRVPSVGNALVQCLVNVVPLQLLAFYWAVERGANVDRPRNLAKSVTVE